MVTVWITCSFQVLRQSHPTVPPLRSWSLRMREWIRCCWLKTHVRAVANLTSGDSWRTTTTPNESYRGQHKIVKYFPRSAGVATRYVVYEARQAIPHQLPESRKICIAEELEILPVKSKSRSLHQRLPWAAARLDERSRWKRQRSAITSKSSRYHPLWRFLKHFWKAWKRFAYSTESEQSSTCTKVFPSYSWNVGQLMSYTLPTKQKHSSPSHPTNFCFVLFCWPCQIAAVQVRRILVRLFYKSLPHSLVSHLYSDHSMGHFTKCDNGTTLSVMSNR